MFEGLSNSEISAVLDELMDCLGVQEEDAAQDLLTALQNKDAPQCAEGIAVRLGLPVKISLSYVPRRVQPGTEGAFETKALARADRTGRGREAIFAQVIIPQYLPMFGTSALQGYPIAVRVTEGCHDHPETFVAVMAHELSHVLLASLRHPKKDSELHADLVPLVLGFRGVVRRGRKIAQSTSSGGLTTTRTTTHGHLTYSQFEFACDHVETVLNRHRTAAGRLAQLTQQLCRKLDTAEQQLATFRDRLQCLDLHPPRAMAERDARKLVEFHGADYTRDWEIDIGQARTGAEAALRSAHPVHYTRSVLARIADTSRNLELAIERLDSVIEAVASDLRITDRYLPFRYRYHNRLCWPWMRGKAS